MPLPEAFSIRLLSPASASARAVVSTVTTLVNDVYTVAEEGLWDRSRAGRLPPRSRP